MKGGGPGSEEHSAEAAGDTGLRRLEAELRRIKSEIKETAGKSEDVTSAFKLEELAIRKTVYGLALKHDVLEKYCT